MSGWSDADGRLGPGAEYYASLGWNVFPVYGIINGRCGCGGTEHHDGPKDFGKRPNGKLAHNGHLDATVDVAKIRGWWAAEPENNIGVACEKSGLLVIDIDPRNGGDEAWEIFESRVGGLPRTVEALTGEYMTPKGPRRGRHLFFRVEDGESFVAKVKDLRGIDFKHKGYVVLTPSRHHSGYVYEWAAGKAPWEIAIAEATDELLGEIRRRPRLAGGSGGSGGAGSAYGVLDWGGDKIDVDALLEEGIVEGERVNKLYPLACAFANQYPVKTEHGKASVRAIMRGINSKHVTPPLDDEELDFQVERALTFVEENPLTEKLWPGIESFKETVGIWNPGVSGAAGAVVPGTVVGTTAGGGGGSSAVVPAAGTAVRTGGGSGAGETAGIAGLSDTDMSALPRDADALREDEGGKIGDRSMSDAGNGRRVVDYAGSVLRYTAGLGWFVWKGEYWIPDTGRLEISEIAKRLPRWVASEIARAETPDKAEALLKWANRAKTRAVRETAIRDAESDERIVVPVSAWDAHPHMLGVKNGVINLRTGTLTTENRELYITKQVQVAYSPGVTNVRWTEFLNFVTGGDKELARYLQLAAGYTLTGDRHHECLFMVHGPAGSGKSTFLDVLGTLLGSYRITFAADVLQDTGNGPRGSQEYYMAKLMGRRMLAISELPEAVQLQEDAIKRLTGDTEISGRNPGGEPFEFMAQAKLWIGTNHKPKIGDDAMWRRIRAIPFNNVPEKPDPDLKPYLLDPAGALPAALSWAVEGAMMLLGSSDRQPLRAAASAAVQDATDKYKISENRLGIFLDEETSKIPGGSVNGQELWMVYQQWSEMRGEKPMTYIAFSRKLEEQGETCVGVGRRMEVKNRTVAPRAVVTPSGGMGWDTIIGNGR